jgi:hypothetical protein
VPDFCRSIVFALARALLEPYFMLERAPGLGQAVQQLSESLVSNCLRERASSPLVLMELRLIDEYEFLVQPKLADHMWTLFPRRSKPVGLRLVSG